MRPKIILDWYERDKEYALVVPAKYEDGSHVGDFLRMRDLDYCTCEVNGMCDSRYKLKDNGYCTLLDQEGMVYFIRSSDVSYGRLSRFIEDLHLYMEEVLE